MTALCCSAINSSWKELKPAPAPPPRLGLAPRPLLLPKSPPKVVVGAVSKGVLEEE